MPSRTGGGHAGSWGSTEGFRLNVAMNEAQRIEQMLTGCEESGDSAAATTVRCTFDMHAYHSDEIGLGPYTDNYWDFVVRDGKITSAVPDLCVPHERLLCRRCGSRSRRGSRAPIRKTCRPCTRGWAPLFSEESIRLWEERTKEWVETVNAKFAVKRACRCGAICLFCCSSAA